MRAPDGSVRLDTAGRANGRGAYVCRDATCIGNATRRGALARALTAAIPPGLETELAAAAGLTTDTPGGASGQE